MFSNIKVLPFPFILFKIIQINQGQKESVGAWVSKSSFPDLCRWHKLYEIDQQGYKHDKKTSFNSFLL